MIRIIIDAYNLIFQCGFQPKKLDAPMALHQARKRLISELVLRIDPRKRPEVMLVFDAKNPRGHATPELIGQGFKIAFARDFEDADAMVVELLRTHSQPRQLIVVSSDHFVQTAATRRDATAIDADEWFDRLSLLSNSPSNDSPEKPESIFSEDETRKLIDTFSEPEVPDRSPKVDGKKAGDTAGDSTYNPFPPGYGEDLLN